MSDQTVRVVEVFADVCCPFTHVGLRRFVQRRHERGADGVRLRVRAWPLELVNGEPLDAELVAEEVDELRAQVAADLFAGFDAGRFPRSSIDAMALAGAAYRLGDDVGERISLALRDAVFEQGRDVSDPAVLGAIAAEHGVDVPGADGRVRVVDEWHEGQRRGVVGSPNFFVDDRGWFCPGLEIERVDGRLQIGADSAEFREFLDRCFG
jgi:predicted DsbA family dithiol-disulfide isomerase